MKAELFLASVEGQKQGSRDVTAQAKASIKRLEKRLAKLETAEARAYSGYVRGLASEETYRRVSAELRAERTWIVEERERLGKALEDAQHTVVKVDAIRELYPLLLERLQRATFEDKRFILERLDARVTVGESGVSLSLAVPDSALSAVSTTPGWAGWEDSAYGNTPEPLELSTRSYSEILCDTAPFRGRHDAPA